jgi:hypothetical protein
VAGDVQLGWVMDALEELLGASPALDSLEALEFHDELGPGERVRLRLETDAEGTRFRFRLADAERPGRVFSSGRGSLRR